MDATEELTPAQATARLSELQGDPDWVKAYLAGSGPKRAEFTKLTELASRVDKIDRQIAGTDHGSSEWLDREYRDGVQTAQLLRDGGVHEPDIARQVISNEAVAQAEHDAAKVARDRLMKNPEFVRKYLSGEGEAVRQMTLLNVVITREIKGGDAESLARRDVAVAMKATVDAAAAKAKTNADASFMMQNKV